MMLCYKKYTVALVVCQQNLRPCSGAPQKILQKCAACFAAQKSPAPEAGRGRIFGLPPGRACARRQCDQNVPEAPGSTATAAETGRCCACCRG